MRKHQLVENEFYHIYNRGTEKRKIFLDDADYFRFLLSMRLMNDEKDGLMFLWKNQHAKYPNGSIEEFLRSNLKKRQPLVEFICYSLVSNHFHLMMCQLAERGIEKFMQRIGIGYAMYFNSRYRRNGSLFQGKFKSSLIKPENFLYLSAYINCNAEIHGVAKSESWCWSSYSDYLEKTKYGLCNKKIVMSNFRGSRDYRNFAAENINSMKEKKADEKLILE
ncbi:MAG TPA: transposase [Candidatus Bathyarchaeia archaeon]|nr:transposase [Candidatus Bathyarchaeia archaeon]